MMINKVAPMPVSLLSALFFLLFSTAAHAIPDLSIGPFGPGITDGTEPFNTDGNCATDTATAAPGDDCGEKNNQVRTQDDVIFNWSITANNFTPGQDPLANVILEQILTPSTNAVVSFPRIPARCTPAGGGGTTPASSITTEPNGDIKLVCNLGEFEDGEQTSFSVYTKVSGESWNGESFTSRQRVYSLADDGITPNANEGTFLTPTPYVISARPMADLSSSGFRGYYLYGARDVGQGVENGYYTWVNIRVATPQKSGTEAIKQPFDFTFNLTATKQAVDGDDYTNSGFEYYMISCYYNRYGYWSGEVFGKETYHASYPIEQKVVDSGTCAYNRDTPADNASPYTMSFNNADLSGSRFPTKAGGNIDLSAGPYYYVNMIARFFIPMRVIDNEDGIMDGNGDIYITSVLENFDPEGVSGVSNFNGDKEPGYNGNPMPDTTKSNNIAGPYNYLLTTRGTWSHSARPYANDAGNSLGSFAGSWHSGGGILPPDDAYITYTPLGNNGSNDLSNPYACNVFDNTTQVLTDRGDVGATPGTYAYVGTHNSGGFDHTNYTVEYGHIDLTGDDPLDKDGDGTPDYNDQTGRYEGKWDVAGLARCDDATTTWHTDPNAVSGGIDAVNIIRVRLKDSVKDSVKLNSTQYIRFITPLKPRDTFFGGPHDGDSIPMGTVLASFGSVKVDEYWGGNWTPANTRPYKPAPESSNTDGDRVTLARTSSFLDSESLTPVATPGNTNTTVAGNQIVWKANSSISSLVPEPALEENVQIIAELPPEVSYNQSCTASYDDGNGNTGTPASLIENNTDRDGNASTGYTRLIWNLGTITANTPIQPRVICTDTDPLTPNNTAVVAYFEIKGDTLVSLRSQRSDTHTITLEQIGSIQVSKKVDLTLDDKDDDQQYTLRWANFAPSFPINAPTIIDVFPYDGDGSAAGSERTPPSVYDGTLELTGAPNVTWLDGSVPTGGNPVLGTWFYTNDAPNSINSDPDQNTSDWCLEADFGSGSNPGCPTNFAGVTAIKFVSNYELEKDGDPKQGMEATLTMQATGNNPGNIYSNRFAFDSSSLPPEQFLLSNAVSVHIASYSIGDFIFADIDKNGQFDVGVDKPLPDGVTLNLHQASDNAVVQTVLSGQERPGRYVFNKLGSGDYYIEIPASEFQPGSILEDWDTLYTVADSDDDKNEAEDQDGYKAGDPVTNGIRSNVITLSATPPLPGQVPKGDEPLGDNTANITDLTGDDFSNYTLDIALQPIYDLGDAPATYGIAPHMQANLTAFPYLGVVKPDRETITPHSANADGDGNDEDAIDTKAFPAWEIGQKCAGRLPDGTMGEVTITETSYCMTVNVVNPTATAAQVVAWIDFNEDDVFNEAEERSVVNLNTDSSDDATQGNVPANTVNQTIVLQWNGVTRPANDSYARIRITTDAAFKDSTYLAATASAIDGEVEDYVFSLAPISATVSGRVYNDANADGVNDAAETGISRLPVVLMNTADNSCVSVKTDDDGYYTFEEVPQGNYQLYEASKETTPVPANCSTSYAKDPAGYLSTTANVLAAFAVDDAPVTDKDFGDVTLPTLTPDGTQDILPGNVVYYPHTFNSPANGSINFNLNENAPTGWSSLLYRDSDCNGTLNGTEGTTALTAAVNTTAGEDVCLLHKVFAAADASNGQQSIVTLTADFTYGDGSTLAANQQLSNTDITTARVTDTADKAGKLELIKSVQNITQGTPETETQNQAKPGDVLQYRITYRNTGTAAITDLTVNDSAPEFTEYVNGTAACPNTPATLSCSADASNAPDMRWNFTGNLEAGAQGNVVYRVLLE